MNSQNMMLANTHRADMIREAEKYNMASRYGLQVNGFNPFGLLKRGFLALLALVR